MAGIVLITTSLWLSSGRDMGLNMSFGKSKKRFLVLGPNTKFEHCERIPHQGILRNFGQDWATYFNFVSVWQLKPVEANKLNTPEELSTVIFDRKRNLCALQHFNISLRRIGWCWELKPSTYNQGFFLVPALGFNYWQFYSHWWRVKWNDSVFHNSII